jgi:hypothetical protein
LLWSGAWQQLTDFYYSPNLFEWWLVTGPAGTGKSRLALEFCREVLAQSRTPVSAGFWAQQQDNAIPYNWSNSPVRPWLIAIDYAAAREKDIKNIMTAIREKLANNTLQHPVRLLLLERTIPADWLAVQTKGLYLRLEGGAIAPFKETPLELGAALLEEKLAFAEKIFVETLNKADKTVIGEELQNYLLSIYSIDPLLRPLFVFFCAKAVVDNTDIRDWQSSDLLRNWLQEHEEPRWKRLLQDIGKEDIAAWKNLLAIATMCYGLTEEQVTQLYKTDMKDILPQPAEQTESYYKQYMAGIGAEGIWRPLEPDVLGEYFVQQYLQTTGLTGFAKQSKEALQEQLIATA